METDTEQKEFTFEAANNCVVGMALTSDLQVWNRDSEPRRRQWLAMSRVRTNGTHG